MKIKYLLVTLLSILMIFSMSQIFSIPPYAGDVYPLYRSGYFSEIERGFMIISDSFIGIKTLGKPEYAWIFLQDVERDSGIDICVYDRNGSRVFMPGKKGKVNGEVAAVIKAHNPRMKTAIRGGRYSAVIPLGNQKKCNFCHNADNGNKIVGALRFERDFDAHVYYTSERIIIFVILSLLTGGLLAVCARWDPGRRVKELFDKK